MFGRLSPQEGYFGADKCVVVDHGAAVNLWDLSKYNRSPSSIWSPQPRCTSFALPANHLRLCVGVSRNNRTIACASQEKGRRVCVVWLARRRVPIVSAPLAHGIRKLTVSDDGSLVVLFEGNMGSILSVETGEVVRCFEFRSPSPGAIVCGSLSSDNTRLATLEEPCIRDVETQTQLFSFSSLQYRCCAFANNSSQVAWSGSSGKILLTDSRVHKPHTMLRTPAKYNTINGCAFTPDNKNILCCGHFDGVRVFSCETGKEMVSLDCCGDAWDGCDVSADGTLFLAYTFGHRVVVWSAQTNETAAIYHSISSGTRVWAGANSKQFSVV